MRFEAEDFRAEETSQGLEGSHQLVECRLDSSHCIKGAEEGIFLIGRRQRTIEIGGGV